MAAGDLQACSWAINGCVTRLFLVFFSYSFREASKVACKLGEKELRSVGVVSDMEKSTKRAECMRLAVW